MKPSKILFEEDVYTRMMAYKKAKGVSVQKFVTDAVLERLEKVEIEEYLKDLPYLNDK